MTRRVMAAAAVLVVAQGLGVGTAVAAPGGCQVLSAMGLCLVEAADPGRPGGPSAPQAARGAPSARSASASRPRSPNIAAVREQAAAIPETLIQAALGIVLPEEAAAAAAAAAGAQPEAAAAPIDPAVPTRIAINRLALRAPTIRLSAEQQLFVGVPVWLWIDQADGQAEPATAVAAVGDAQVQATARLAGVEWSMGPDGAKVFCVGAGTPWTGQEGPSPDCGYTYRERSLPIRTNGSGRWPVTATAIWQVEWEGVSDGEPVAGMEELRLESEATIPVDEVQVLVTGGGR